MNKQAKESKLLIFSLLMLAVIQPCASAELRQYRLDPEKSRVSFEVGATFHSVRGEAKQAEGNVSFDSKAGAVELPAQIEIPAALLDTGMERRDKHLRKMLQADDYPAILWSASRVKCEPAEASKTLSCDASGTLKIKNIERDVSFPVLLTQQENGIRAEGSLKLARKDFDLKTPFTFGIMRVDQEIKIEFDTFWS